MPDGEPTEVEYQVIESEPEIHPDNPLHPMWTTKQMVNILEEYEGADLIERKVDIWFSQLKNQFESFEQHRNSSLFVDYGHDYSVGGKARTMNLKEIVPGEYSGGVDYRWWSSLQNALRYRLQNYGTRRGGWSIFDRVKGDYEVSIVDTSILQLRNDLLDKFLDIINSDTKLTTIDPLTNEKAITNVDPNRKEMEGIRYMFPFGTGDTTTLHYYVMEPIMEEETGEVEQNVIKLAQYFGCKDILKTQ